MISATVNCKPGAYCRTRFGSAGHVDRQSYIFWREGYELETIPEGSSRSNVKQNNSAGSKKRMARCSAKSI